MNLIEYSEDFTEDDKKSLASFKENGCPGLTKIDDNKVFKWFELYMSGKSYNEIAEITSDKKDLILYVSNKMKWHEKRMKYYEDLALNMTKKMSQVKISSMNTLSSIMMGLNKYYEDKFTKYLSSKDNSLIEGLDTKLLTQYYQSIKTFHTLANPNQSIETPNKPTINVNVGSNVEVKKTGENTIEINDSTVGNVLKKLAAIKDEEEDDGNS
jgi:hypothetical protein